MIILKKIIPRFIKNYLNTSLSTILRKIKEPKMLWGYQDSSGIFRERTRISDTVFFYHPEKISIEDNVFIWHYTILDGTGGLKIGEGTQIGAWVGIFTHSSHIAIRLYGDHYQEIPESEKIGYPIKSVTIGKYVFIGAGSKVLPGVNISDGALISAGSVITKNVNKFEIVSGNPAKVIGDTKKIDKRYLNNPEIKKWYEEWQTLE